MNPREIVMSGYQSFQEGNMEALGSIYHEKCVIKVNGAHELSGKYIGFTSFLQGFLSKIPENFPNFRIEIINVTAEDNRVHVLLNYKADNLESQSVHIFVVEDGLQTEFLIIDDSQKIAAALSA